MLDFRVLGPLEIISSGVNIAPTALKPRQVVSLLVLRRNTVVPTAELIDTLWEDNPPASAMTTLQTYIYKLRKLLAGHGMGDTLHTHASGYSMTIPDSAVDLFRFEQRVSEGKAALEADDQHRASAILANALGMWRGPVLMDVATGNLLSAYTTKLEEVRLRTVELRIDTGLKANRHVELISELKSLVVTHPLHERFHLSLMVALARSGRRCEALEVYRKLRESLVRELGLEPGPELQRLHRSLLATDPATPPATAPATNVPPAQLPPAQLPPDVADLTGRDQILARLEHAIRDTEASERAPTALPVIVISGMPGVGKSALATALAHRLRSRFGDGQIYADLRASTGTPRDPMDVLDELLRGLGVPRHHLADTVEERGKQLRSVTANRRILLVLDDAAATKQVRPLLPGNAACAVVVTSRRRLSDLAGVRRVMLDPLSRADGVELLARITGDDWTERDRRAAQWLVDTVAGLPLALRCAGCRLTSIPGYSLSQLVDELAQAPHPLAALSFGEFDIWSRFDASYQRLGAVEQGIFRLLSSLPISEFSTAAGAELIGWEVPRLARVVEQLHEHNLLRTTSGPGGVVHTFPRLVRAYALERLMTALLKGPAGATGTKFRIGDWKPPHAPEATVARAAFTAWAARRPLSAGSVRTRAAPRRREPQPG